MLENGPLGRGETILIVDDESITRMMVRKVLEEGGYRVVEADDGDEAVTRAGERMPDLVLLDVRMPRMNGFDTCRSLRELPQGDHVPILMLTGLDDVVAVQLAFDAGATDFITKPINWALLGQRLRYALRTKEQEERLRESESRLAHAQQLARLGQWRYESRNARLSVSSNLAKHLGLTGGPDTLGADVLIRHIHQRDRFKVLRRLLRVWRDGRPLDLEFRLLNAEGRLCTVHLRIERGGDGDEIFLHGTAQDVSARIEAEARISYFSHYDTLTELPNRILFWDRLTHNIADSRRSGNQFAVLLLGLDRFAAINASLGHSVGDRILRILARRLAENLRASDTLSRIGGDEFAIIYKKMESERDLGHFLSRIVDGIRKPIKEEGLDAVINASIGIALFPNDGDELETLLMHADVAKERAKAAPGLSYQFYTPALGESARERMMLESALRRAIEEESFVLHYQPLVSLQDGGVWGVEVLLRWRHPESGLMLPDLFVPVLEEGGLLPEVGEWVLRRACKELSDSNLVVSVNLSPVQFMQHELVSRLQSILAETGFPPERLQLEITENVLIDDHERAQTTLDALRRLKIKVAIDDFGTGFSSLAYLKLYHVDFLKIDRSFIGEMNGGGANRVIVRSTIGLGHDLNMRIIGEGVEHTEDLESLVSMGCDLAQGFLIARPMDKAALGDWLASR